MFKLFTMLLVSALGLSPHREAFLSAAHHSEPAEEVMGPNMNFAPISTTMQCTINLTLQFMVVYVALGICRTYLSFTKPNEDYNNNGVAKALAHASRTVFYAPMVCLMFVGFRMRVLQLSKGTGNPQDWVRFAMQAVAYSILANTLMVLVCAYVAEPTKVKLTKTGEMDISNDDGPFESKSMLATIFTVIRYFVFLGLYVGFGAVCVGVFLYEPPAGTWEGDIPPLSPAVACTMTLCTAFFMIYFLHACSRTYSQFTNQENSNFEKVMERAADTLGMAPMLCVLFLAARMRALQMDPVGGNPQKWAQNCFYTCTYSLIAQCVLAVAVPLVLKIKVADSDSNRPEGDLDYVYDGQEGGYDKDSYTAKTLSAVRFIIMLGVYVAGTAVVCSVFTIEHPDGAEHTPAISPTVQCVINLAFQYFFIYLMLWVFITVEDFTESKDKEGKNFMTKAKHAIQSAKATVEFAPMLCVLFIATRMRALQITKNQGAPQGYVQDGMYLASWSVLIQFLMCLIMPFFTGATYVTDTLDGKTAESQIKALEAEESKKKGDTASEKSSYASNVAGWGAYVVSFIRYCALLALLGGVATVITGVFLMTPENANGRGAIPLVSDGTLPIDLAPAPPSVTDLPGAETAMKATGETVGAGADVVNDAGATVTSPVASVADTAADAVH